MLPKTQRERSTIGLYATKEWVSFRSSAHNTIRTRPTCVLFFFPFSFFLAWSGGDVIDENWDKCRKMNRIRGIKLSSRLLSDAPIVPNVNTGVGGGNLAMPAENCSIYAHKMPRFWFMALPLGHGFLSPPLVAIQTSQHNYNIYCCWTTLSNTT